MTRIIPLDEMRLLEAAIAVPCPDDLCGADIGQQCKVNPSGDPMLAIDRREGASLKRCLVALLHRIEVLEANR